MDVARRSLVPGSIAFLSYASLYVLAVAARLVAGFSLGIGRPPTSDESFYYGAAVSVASGEGYCKVPQQSADAIKRPTAFEMPGTSLALALAFLICGQNPLVARLYCIGFSSLSAPLLFLYCKQIGSSRAAFLAGLACAFWPSSVYLSTGILSECFFVPTLVLSLVATTATATNPNRWIALATGLSWGLTTLMRPFGLPIGILAILYVSLRSGLMHGVIMLAGLTAIYAPWVIRNDLVFGRPVLLSTEAGETFLGANNPYVLRDRRLRGSWIFPGDVREYRERLATIEGEVERDRAQTAMGISFLREQPDAIPLLAFYKLRKWLSPVTGAGGMVRLAVLCSYGALLIALCFGLFLGVFRNSIALHLNLLCSFTFAAATAVYWGNLVRGRLPLEIIWIPWGTLAGLEALGRFRAKIPTWFRPGG